MRGAVWKRLGLAVFAAVLAYAGYDYVRGGWHKLPEMPDGAFPISFKSGLRAIVLELPDERATRRYFGFATEVPFFVEGAWSLCSPAKGDEIAEAENFMANLDLTGMRFEAICRVDVDGEKIVTGAITTVPRL